jgi:alkylation response protein AidB-like acyl-CoA dehydrogenase
MATEAGYAAADASMQALGGYGYAREYFVEKIARDVRITRIFEGTSEIMEMTIARDRWQEHLKSHGSHYHDEATRAEAVHVAHPDVGAGVAALALNVLAEVLERARASHLTRSQHILFRLGELIANAECAASLSRRAAVAAEGRLHPKANNRFAPDVLAAIARIFARNAALKVAEGGIQWLSAAEEPAERRSDDLERALRLGDAHASQAGLLTDMDLVAGALFARTMPPNGNRDNNRNGAL